MFFFPFHYWSSKRLGGCVEGIPRRILEVLRRGQIVLGHFLFAVFPLTVGDRVSILTPLDD